MNNEKSEIKNLEGEYFDSKRFKFVVTKNDENLYDGIIYNANGNYIYGHTNMTANSASEKINSFTGTEIFEDGGKINNQSNNNTMYKSPELIKQYPDWKTIVINNQDEIMRKTGSELSLQDVYELIRKTSDDFTREDPAAKEADKLLSDLILDSFGDNKPEPVPASAEKTEADAEASIEDYKETLDQLQSSLEFIDSEEDRLSIVEAIESIETLIELMA